MTNSCFSTRTIRQLFLFSLLPGVVAASGCKSPDEGTANPEDAVASADTPVAEESEPEKRKPSRASFGTATKGHDKKVKAVPRLKAAKPKRSTSTAMKKAVKKVGKANRLKVDGFTPVAAAPGSEVVVDGNGLQGKASDFKISVGGTKWKVVKVSNGTLTALVPKGAKDGRMLVQKGKAKAKSGDVFRAIVDDGGFGTSFTEDNGHGLQASVFKLEAGTTEMPDFSELGQPALEFAMATVDVKPYPFGGFPADGGRLKENFAIQLLGSFNIEEEGEMELCLNSADGAQLLLEDTLVVDNDGVHDSKDACELIYLEAGEYQLELRYFFTGGKDAGLQFSWTRDGAEAAAVPSSVLYLP